MLNQLAGDPTIRMHSFLLRYIILPVLFFSLTLPDAFGQGQSLVTHMPDDQVLFERGVSKLNDLERGINAARNSGNPFRARKLELEFNEVHKALFLSRKVQGWLCRFDWIERSERISPSMVGAFAIKCMGDNAAYLLIAQNNEKTTNALAEMTYGQILRFDGAFHDSLEELYDLQLNSMNFWGPIVQLSN